MERTAISVSDRSLFVVARRERGAPMSDQAELPLSGSGDDPRHHTGKLHDMLTRVAEHAREDVGKISEPKAGSV